MALGIVGGEHGKTGRAAGHDIQVITENRQCLGGNGPRRDMKNRQSVLRRFWAMLGIISSRPWLAGKGRGQCSGLQCAMYCACRPGLRLHLR